MKLLCVSLLLAEACLAADFATGQAARLVIGQTSFTNQDEGATDLLIGAAGGIAWANNTLFVVDGNRFSADPVNNRVLLFPTRTLPKPTDALSFPPAPPAPPEITCLVCANTRATVFLGQPDANNNAVNLNRSGMRTPTAAASDGVHLAVADTDNNRVLIWNTIPTQAYNQPADLVLGQPDFTHNVPAVPPTAKSMRGPGGLWFQNGKLLIADTQNNRVLIYNSIPTANGAAADVVIGQSNFTTQISTTQVIPTPTASNLLSPVSVTSDGQRMFVTDLGANRVLIWNAIPTTSGAPADLVLGQPDFTSYFENNSPALCASNGTDTNNNATYPARCSKTMSFPRFALSDGHRLFVADGGNDRVLVYSQLPTANSTPADIILGEPDDLTDNPGAGADQFQTPSSLAWDGTNLYIADVFNRRVLAYSPGDRALPASGIRNAASLEVFALARITIAGTITEKDTVTITIALQDNSGNTVNTKDYTYTVAKTDTLTDIVNGLVALINKAPGDPNSTARPDIAADGTLFAIILSAKSGGAPGTLVNVTTAVSTNATETATASNATLQLNLQDAAQLAAGTLVTIFGSNLSTDSAVAPLTGPYLPPSLVGTQVYIDGIPAPLVSVSPTQINAQMPFEVQDRSSVSVYVRTVRPDGTVQVTTPEAVPIVIANPGIFANEGTDPRVGKVYHAFSNATGAISVDGTITAGNVGTITITNEGGDTETYTYTVLASDTLQSVQQAFIDMINNDPNSSVTATASNVFTRILLVAKNPGTGPQSITYTATVGSSASLILTALTTQLCCASSGDALVTQDNPAVAGEFVYIYATGLGPATGDGVFTGKVATNDDASNPPMTPVDSILAGGATANIVSTGFVPGTVGIYKVVFQLSSSLTPDPQTQLTIAQQDFVSNVVTFPVAAVAATAPTVQRAPKQ